MAERPRALDLFCKAGGASMGLHRAGFDVIGVDIEPQKNYPFPFVQADALAPPFDLGKFDLIWASPVCKRFVNGAEGYARNSGRDQHPNFIPAIRALLADHPLTCIENVMKAPLRADLVLHGHMFGLKVIRRRQFELSWPYFELVPPLPRGLLREGFVCVVGNGTPTGVLEMGLPMASVGEWRQAMGIDWMTKTELAQAIPPAYSEFIGKAALRAMGRRDAL